LECFGVFWSVLECFGVFWSVLECGTIAPTGAWGIFFGVCAYTMRDTISAQVITMTTMDMTFAKMLQLPLRKQESM